MHYNITLPLPSGWVSEVDNYVEFDGSDVTHMECHLMNSATGKDDALVDIYVGEMPEDTSAEDEAFANYAEMIGWDDDEDDDSAIVQWAFNGRKAFGFEAYTDDDASMRVMCIEIKKGVLVVMNIMAKNDSMLAELVDTVEKKLRIK